MKILHTADWHVKDSEIAEVRKCLEHMLEVASETRLDLIVIAGDMTDSQNVKLDSRSARLIFETVTGLAHIAPVVIPIGTRSHDGYAPELLRNIRATYPVHITRFPDQLILNGSGGFWSGNEDNCRLAEARALISIVPSVTKQFFQSELGITDTDQAIAARVGRIFNGFATNAATCNVPHILVGHWAIGGAYVSEHQQLIGRDIEMSREQVELANADLVCLGHIHLHQQIGNNIFYSGSIHRNNFGELEEKGFYIHTLQNGSLDSRFIKTPTRKLIRLDADFTRDPIEKLDEILYTRTPEELHNALVRIELTVFQDEVERIDQDAIKAFLTSTMSGGAKSVDIKLIRIPRVNVRSERFFELTALPDKLREQAAIRDEPEPSAGILDKAADLETRNPDAIFEAVSGTARKEPEPVQQAAGF